MRRGFKFFQACKLHVRNGTECFFAEVLGGATRDVYGNARKCARRFAQELHGACIAFDRANVQVECFGLFCAEVRGIRGACGILGIFKIRGRLGRTTLGTCGMRSLRFWKLERDFGFLRENARNLFTVTEICGTALA